MPAAEVAFESLNAVLEAVRGTAITPPDHRLNLNGMITPVAQVYHAPDNLGTLEEYSRSERTHLSGKLKGDGALDTRTMPFLCRMFAKGGSASPSTPATAVLSRLWAFNPTLTADDLDSATVYWGDPNVKMFQEAFTMLDQIKVTANSGASGGTMLSVEGTGHFPDDLGSVPTLPASNYGPLILPGNMQVWIDTSSAIGTTAVTGRVVSVEHTFPTGVTYKYPAQGPGGTGINFDHIGRKKRHITTKMILELIDLTEYNLWKAYSNLKVRVRHNGPLIETISSTSFYHYFEVDTYGPFSGFAWGALEGTNRTVELTIESEVNAVAGRSWSVRVQNDQTTI